MYLKASNDNARVGALGTVIDALGLYSEIIQTGEVIERLAKVEEAVQEERNARR